MCTTCKGVGYVEKEVPVFTDGGYTDVDQITVNCDCNPEPSDDDAPHWASDEPRGTAYDDFHPLGY
jgi:hypothetical protein